MPVVTLIANAVTAQLRDADDNAKNIATETLSYLVEGAEHMALFKSHRWDGRSSFFTRRTCTFPAGFLHLMHNALINAGYQVRIGKRPLPAPQGPANPKVDEFGNDDPRYDFQLNALRAVEQHGCGIIQVATGGGKSKIAKLITARYRRMTLFLTTRGVLMYQMKDALENDCGFKVGVIGDGNWSPTTGVNVGMVQTLVAHLKEPDLNEEIRDVIAGVEIKGIKTTPEKIREAAEFRYKEKVRNRERMIKILGMFEVVIGEEAHEAGGNSYYEILRWCKNAQIRVALTATPFMRASAEDNMRLMAAFGPIILKVSEQTLIERGILAKPYFLYRSPAPHPKLRKSSPWQRAYQLGIAESEPRNADIVFLATKAVSHGLPVMILVQRKQHGAELRNALRARGVKVEFIQGADDQPERKAALGALGSGKIQVLIGTTILDVGVDVPAVGMVILAGGGKAEIGLRQRVGRGLRAKKHGPNVAFIVDYTDELNSHLRDHAKQRRAIVEATPGFCEGIISPGTDLPWELFAKKAA